MLVSLTVTCTFVLEFVWWARPLLRAAPLLFFVFQFSNKKGDIYNILWALVFGFATLNILALVTRRFEPGRARLSFGETLAIMVVVVSVFLLGWEMLYLFKVLPIKLQPR
jgi:hypothetical protein